MPSPGIPFIIEDDVVGALHHFFGRNLVGDTRLDLLGGGMVSLRRTANAFVQVEVHAHNFVDKLVEVRFVDNGTFEYQVGHRAVPTGKLQIVVPHTGVDKVVETTE